MGSKKIVSINFVNVNSQIFLSDSIWFDTRSGAMLNCTLKNIPDYACGIYLTWNDSLLDNKLPYFIGLGGEILTKEELKQKIYSNNDYIVFPNGNTSVKPEDILNNDYIDDNDDFLIYNIQVEQINQETKTKELIDAKLVVWHFEDYTLVCQSKEQLLNYINTLPVKVKHLRNKHIPSPLQ